MVSSIYEVKMLKKFTAAILSNSFYFLTGSILFLLFISLAWKTLGSEKYGLWIMMIGLTQSAGFANLGMNATVERYIARYVAMEQQRELGLSVTLTLGYFFVSALGILASLGIWLSKDLIALNLNTSATSPQSLSRVMGILALSLPFLFLGQVSKGVLYGLIQNKLAGGIDFALNQILWLGAIFIGKTAGTITNLASWELFVAILGFLLYTAYALRALQGLHFRWMPVLEKSLAAELLRYSLFSWITTLGILLFQSADRLLVGILISPAAAGAYSIASSVALRVNMLVGQFTQALSPLASNYQAINQVHKLRALFEDVAEITSWISIASGSLLVIWMDDILRLWISPSFSSEYTQVFRLVVIAYAWFSTSRAAHQTLTGMGAVRVTACFTICGAFLVLLMIYLLAPIYGIAGAAIGNFFYSVVVLMSLYLASRFSAHTLIKVAKEIIATIGILLLVLFLVYINPFQAHRLLISTCILILTGSQLAPYLKKFAGQYSNPKARVPQKA